MKAFVTNGPINLNRNLGIELQNSWRDMGGVGSLFYLYFPNIGVKTKLYMESP